MLIFMSSLCRIFAAAKQKIKSYEEMKDEIDFGTMGDRVL